MRRQKNVSRMILIGVILFQLSAPAAGFAQPGLLTPAPQDQAAALLEQMTPEERVGQLFLVEFTDADLDPDGQLYDLIFNRHIGGVALTLENNNFPSPNELLSRTREFNEEIQRTEWTSSTVPQVNPETGETFLPAYVPLFISLSQDGDGFPADQILSGLTPIPNLMAIGASWNPEIATATGEIVGKELSAIGFNLLFGPSLDVAENPRPESSGDLGANTFGGNPYWVGVMGQSYIAGLHTGSNNRIAVVAKHFPGHTGSDRPPDEEIPSIRKDLDQLLETEFAPFIAVTGSAPSREATVDGVLLTHAKYQGLQGNLQPSTRPISFDPEGFEELISQPEFLAWHDNGGLIISDDLATRAVRRFFDPTERVFNARLVALNAFLSGNDVLYLGNFVADGDPNSYTTIASTLEFFARKYRDDQVFAQRVDAAVLRILALKFKLYGSFTIDDIIRNETAISEIGKGTDITIQTASEAATLFSPARGDLNSVLPSPPGQNEIIVIFSDTYIIRQCTICQADFALDPFALEEAIVRLYGPQATGQVISPNIISYTYEDLDKALSLPEDEENLTLEDIKTADWIVALNLDSNPERPSSQALRHFLSERPDLLQGKRTLVFALEAPYYLDASEISKITAYYGLYSKQPQFIELAARILFKEFVAQGASPVSISGIEYDLVEATLPDPEQTFTFYLYKDGEVPDDDSQPVPIQEYQVGDSITLETGVIVDRNKHPVPDNTSVRLLLITTTTEGTTNQREIVTPTLAGRVKVNTILDTAGILAVEAISGDPAARSLIIQVDVVANDEPDVTEESGGNGIGGFFQPPLGPDGVRSEQTTLGDWFLIMMVTLFISLFAYQTGAVAGEVRWGVRWGLTAIMGGLAVSAYLSFDLPGSAELIKTYQIWGIVVVTTIGAGLGWAAGWIWRGFRRFS